MAFVLPVLILCFLGLVELGQYLMLSERVTKTSNQMAAILYSLNASQLQAGNDANNVMKVALRQGQSLARPFHAPTIVIRYCQRDSVDAGAMREIYKAYTDPVIDGCGEGPTCQATAVTQNGFGAFVQTYACQVFRPAVTPRYLTRGAVISQTSFIPLASTNQTALIEAAHGTTVPAESQTGSTTGGGSTGGGTTGSGGTGSSTCTGYNVRKPGTTDQCIDKCLLYPTESNPNNPNDPNTVQGCLRARNADPCTAGGGIFVNGACVIVVTPDQCTGIGGTYSNGSCTITQ